jgi:hypothetical protein
MNLYDIKTSLDIKETGILIEKIQISSDLFLLFFFIKKI